MKVIQIPTLTTDRANYNLNYFCLKFKSSITEENFLLHQLSTTATTNSFKLHFPYILSHLLLFFILLASYLLSNSSTNHKSLACRLVLIGFLIIFNFSLLFLRFCIHEYSLQKKYLFEINYFISSLILIFNSEAFHHYTFQTEGESFLSTLGITALILFSTENFHYNFLVLFSFNVLICTFHAVLTLNYSSSSSVILINLLLILVSLYQVSRSYFQELQDRKKFIKTVATQSKFDENGRSSLEELEKSMKLPDCIEILQTLSLELGKSSKDTMRKVITSLKSIQTSQDSDYDDLNNELDEEDREYIMQNIRPNKISEPAKQKKFRQRQSLESILEKMLAQEVVVILKQVSNTWTIDMFEFSEKSGDIPVTIIGRYTMRLYNLCETLDINEIKLTFFFNEIGKQYKNNPYHNAIHAADVLSSGLYLTKSSEVFSNLLDIEMLIVILSHLTHDVGHPGVNNRFLINISDELAIRYNDISVLENFHASLTFSILKESDKNILENLSEAQVVKVRKWMIEMILATDMAKHFEMIVNLRNKSSKLKDIESPEVRLDLLKMIIHTADIGHSAKETRIHKKWSKLLSKEFFHQGDIEKDRQKPVSMYCDRDKTIFSKSQIGFLKNIALPLFELVSTVLDSKNIQENCVNQLKSNISAWEFEYSSGRMQTLKLQEPGKLLAEISSPSAVLQFKSVAFGGKALIRE